jgi:hypothetical protein
MSTLPVTPHRIQLVLILSWMVDTQQDKGWPKNNEGNRPSLRLLYGTKIDSIIIFQYNECVLCVISGECDV